MHIYDGNFSHAVWILFYVDLFRMNWWLSIEKVPWDEIKSSTQAMYLCTALHKSDPGAYVLMYYYTYLRVTQAMNLFTTTHI